MSHPKPKSSYMRLSSGESWCLVRSIDRQKVDEIDFWRRAMRTPRIQDEEQGSAAQRRIYDPSQKVAPRTLGWFDTLKGYPGNVERTRSYFWFHQGNESDRDDVGRTRTNGRLLDEVSVLTTGWTGPSGGRHCWRPSCSNPPQVNNYFFHKILLLV